ncbi:MAG: hypothetical protein BWY09_01382 [Candidatus Hydrogenedentes bacterium ADurb.Bin179]|nr:MAG: hypothetical protein BWY09_01382 [Candidatus Hydrogenedentes bacterium ADurb.Bin179]
MVLVAVDRHIQFRVVRQSGQGQVTGTHNAHAVLKPLPRGVMEDIGLRVEPAAGIYPQLQPPLHNKPHDLGYHRLFRIALVHERQGLPQLQRRFRRPLPRLLPRQVLLPLLLLLDQLRPMKGRCQMLNRLPVRRVPDQQAQPLRRIQGGFNRPQTGKKEIAHRKVHRR